MAGREMGKEMVEGSELVGRKMGSELVGREMGSNSMVGCERALPSK